MKFKDKYKRTNYASNSAWLDEKADAAIAVLRWARCYADKLAKELGVNDKSLMAIISRARKNGHDVLTVGKNHLRYYELRAMFDDRRRVPAAQEADRAKRRNAPLT